MEGLRVRWRGMDRAESLPTSASQCLLDWSQRRFYVLLTWHVCCSPSLPESGTISFTFDNHVCRSSRSKFCVIRRDLTDSLALALLLLLLELKCVMDIQQCKGINICETVSLSVRIIVSLLGFSLVVWVVELVETFLIDSRLLRFYTVIITLHFNGSKIDILCRIPVSYVVYYLIFYQYFSTVLT